MPQTMTIASFILGAVLLLIAILSGGFKIFGAEVSGKTGTAGRMISGILGIIFIILGFSQAEEQRGVKNDPGPAPTKSLSAEPGNPAPTSTPIPVSAIASTVPNPVGTSSFVAGPTLPQNNNCPYVQGGFWIQNPNIWYGPFGNGDAIMLNGAGGFFVWDPQRINIYGNPGSVLPYPDPYRTWVRNVWTPLQQSRFSVCVDGSTGNSYGYYQY
ncbi:MAG: hypothetical protein IPG76_05370 [Acidobacteria bacterium]|nr:hypothetical protein [Acidobacteriota bacterium]